MRNRPTAKIVLLALLLLAAISLPAQTDMYFFNPNYTLSGNTNYQSGSGSGVCGNNFQLVSADVPAGSNLVVTALGIYAGTNGEWSGNGSTEGAAGAVRTNHFVSVWGPATSSGGSFSATVTNVLLPAGTPVDTNGFAWVSLNPAVPLTGGDWYLLMESNPPACPDAYLTPYSNTNTIPVITRGSAGAVPPFTIYEGAYNTSGGYAYSYSTYLGPNLQYAYEPEANSTQVEASGDAYLFNLAYNTNGSITTGNGDDGLNFQVVSADVPSGDTVYITALGFYAVSGSVANNHTLSLWGPTNTAQAPYSSGQELASVTLDAGTPVDANDFAWATLPSPVALVAGDYYDLLTTESDSAGSDAYLQPYEEGGTAGPAVITMTSGSPFTAVSGAYSTSGYAYSDSAYLGPNMQYLIEGPTPFPNTSQSAGPVQTILYSITDPGVTASITNWGLDTTWTDTDNMQRGLNFMGTNLVNLVRIGFEVDQQITNKQLSSSDEAELQTMASMASMANTNAKWDLIVGPVPPTAWFTNGANLINTNRWAEAMELAQQYYNRTMWMTEPFNEPDYSDWGEGSQHNLYNIMQLLEASTNFPGAYMAGGSTLNCNNAVSWYDDVANLAHVGTTHCLAGNVAGYESLIQIVLANGGLPIDPEAHNLVETIIGANCGLNGAIWWGTAELARGSFVNACQGKQLGYAENDTNWTAAAVYRGTNGAVQAFLGGSERMATTTTYRFFSRDRNVFYNGYGPQRDYTVTVPGGTGYQVNQPDMEQVVNISWGADVPLPIGGGYIVANRNSGLALEAASNTEGSPLVQAAYTGASNQIWNICPLTNNFGGDVSFYTMTVGNGDEMANLSSLSYTNGDALQLWPGNATDNSIGQNWIFQYSSNGCFYVRSRWSDLYLATNTSGAIVQWSYLNGRGEQWRLIPVGNVTPTGGAFGFVAPPAPTGLTATANAVAIQLNWNTNSGSTPVTYTVFSATNSGGPYNVIARGLTNTMYLDNSANQAQNYYYVVAAVDGLLDQSAYSSQAGAMPTLAPTLVANYNFEINNLDSSGNNNNAELDGSPGFAPGRYGMALDLDGTNQYAMAPAGVLAGVTNFTIAAWVYWNGGAEWQRIFDFGNGTNQYMFLTPDSGSGTLRFAVTTNGSGAEQRVETSELPADQWFHVTVTLNGTSASLFTNGVLAATGPDAIPPANFNPALNNFGASQSLADPWFSGLLGPIYIYNYALTASQISSLAAPASSASAWATLAITTTNGNLVLTWNMAGLNGSRAVLECNTNLNNPNGWIPVTGAASPYTILIPASGNAFYRIVP